ncbi:phosphatase PAP2 family protein [Xylanibacillus composti]|uniref:Phosphatidylglycerophosphatase B n=1 Tax=Xylanibacillus composti TaxID=1572762 RepID=A0A8J4H709_9BACL|nr:phosphatase PAP2 family protein [Xylanibacillus composti]MDT9724632.1 phosphatase PAP2 family protein [Xylanibacillus composti]GIQ70917.1 phosphatidylglycerophosphatase B [Xylanibacillus composti]
MSRVVIWLHHRELRMFHWINQRLQHQIMDWIMGKITHLGGATFTISAMALLWILASGALARTAMLGLIALAASHIPVAFIKRIYPRLRPYDALPEAILSSLPLKDHSFPSGHTTAIFSIITPFVLIFPLFAVLLVPLALTVAISRIYLGLHYPSDVFVGFILGTSAGIATVMLAS